MFSYPLRFLLGFFIHTYVTPLKIFGTYKYKNKIKHKSICIFFSLNKSIPKHYY